MNMNSRIYQEILVTFLFPFLAEKFNMTCAILYQDNDLKHTSKLCKETLSTAGVKWVKAPAKSPDLNPIELLWHPMKEFVRKRFCKTRYEIAMALLDWMDTITPEYYQRTINHIQKVIKIVINNKGGWSNH